MQIKQFEDNNLAHYSYAVIDHGEMIIIDPSRDPKPYYELAAQKDAVITAVIETHPHADFISSHLEVHHATGATVYVSKLAGAAYPHHPFDEGDRHGLGMGTFRAINTPGHSADSISIILTDESGKDIAVFTGDALLIGDCGRPDLRENVGNVQQTRQDQARQLFYALKKYLHLDDEVLVYPAHGSGSLCGRVLSAAKNSTIGAEKLSNWCLQPMELDAFTSALLAGQSFVPAYFPYDVEMNRTGAPDFGKSVASVSIGSPVFDQLAAGSLDRKIVIIDTRSQRAYKTAHLRNSINLQAGPKFETWLGSILSPGEPFYLAVDEQEEIMRLLGRIAKIGYEIFIQEAFLLKYGDISSPEIDLSHFKKNMDDFTLIDVRNTEEAVTTPFERSIHIPLHQLRERISEIPLDRPLVVYCSSGYRSAAASSLISSKLPGKVTVFDLGESVNEFMQAP